MFDDIRKFVELQSKLDCINSYQPLTNDKNQEPKNYFTEPSICLADIIENN
jgi:hypothetical protein